MPESECKTSHSIGYVYGISLFCAQHSDLQTVGRSATETERATSEGPLSDERGQCAHVSAHTHVREVNVQREHDRIVKIRARIIVF
jgi:hypothetical protein